MRKREAKDLAIIFLWPIIAAIISLGLGVNAFGSVILFLAIPSIYLAFRGKEYVKRAFVFSIIVSIPSIIVIDYIAHLTKQWLIPTSILPFRIFNFVTLEVILWAFFMFFFVVMFYEYFIDKHKTSKVWNKKMYFLSLAMLLLFGIFLFLFLTMPSWLNIPYWYLLFGVLVLLIPFLLQLFKYPKTTSKFFLVLVYFFYMHFIYEITGLKLGWWEFPGTMFVGWVHMFGVSFPIEEIIFWFILVALAILAFFEKFEDDEK